MSNISISSILEDGTTCADDFVYFCEKYFKNPETGKPATLHDYQKRYVQFLNDNNNVIGKLFLKSGLPAITVYWLIWRSLFFGETSIVISEDKGDVGELLQLAKDSVYGMHRQSYSFASNSKSSIKFRLSDGIMLFMTTKQYELHKVKEGTADNVYLHDPAARNIDGESYFKAVKESAGTFITLSTPNEDQGWFHDAYHEAQRDNAKKYSVFVCQYSENPIYHDRKYCNNLKQLLGIREWDRTVLSKFKSDQASCTSSFEDVVSDKVYVNAKETLESLKAFDEFMSLQRAAFKEEPLPNPEEEREEDFDTEYKAEETIIPSGLKKAKRKSYRSWTLDEKNNSKAKRSPYRSWIIDEGDNSEDDFVFNTTEGMVYCWELIANQCPEYESELIRWQAILKEITDHDEKIKDQWSYPYDSYIWALSDLPQTKDQVTLIYPGQTVLNCLESHSDLKSGLKLSFRNGRLTVNDAETKIHENDMKELYNGLFSLSCYSDAIETVVRLVAEKLKPLFGKEEENDAEIPQVCE